jgi:hypothetical protein
VTVSYARAMKLLHAILLSYFLLSACNSASVAVVDLAQHYAAPYQIVPEMDGAVVGAVSPRGLAFTGTGQVSITLFHGRTELYRSLIAIDGCAGLELVADDDQLSLVRVSGSEALRIWPALSCADSVKMRVTDVVERLTLCRIDRSTSTLLPPINLPPPPPPPVMAPDAARGE